MANVINTILNSLINIYQSNSSACMINNVNNQTINLTNLHFNCADVNISDLLNTNVFNSDIQCVSTNLTTDQILQQLSTSLGLSDPSKIPAYLSSNGVVNVDQTSVTMTEFTSMISNVTTCLINTANNQGINLSNILFTDCNTADIGNFVNSMNLTIKESCIQHLVSSLTVLPPNPTTPTQTPTSTSTSTSTSTPTPTQNSVQNNSIMTQIIQKFGSETIFIVIMVIIGIVVLLIMTALGLCFSGIIC